MRSATVTIRASVPSSPEISPTNPTVSPTTTEVFPISRDFIAVIIPAESDFAAKSDSVFEPSKQVTRPRSTATTKAVAALE